MKYLLTLLLLAGSSLCFVWLAGDNAPHSAPSIDTASTARPYHVALIADKTDTVAFVCDSQSAKFYHRWRNCRGLNECTHGATKVSKKDAQQAYGQSQCPVCY